MRTFNGKDTENFKDTYFHENHRGDTVALTDENGDIAHLFEYTTYGQIFEVDEDGELEEFSDFGSLVYGFQGRRADTETNGVYYYRNRYYSSIVGRFLQRDKLGYIDGYGLYQALNSNPYAYEDYLGNDGVLIMIAEWAIEARNATAALAAADLVTPEPTDVAAPGKAIGYGTVITVTSVLAATAYWLSGSDEKKEPEIKTPPPEPETEPETEHEEMSDPNQKIWRFKSGFQTAKSLEEKAHGAMQEGVPHGLSAWYSKPMPGIIVDQTTVAQLNKFGFRVWKTPLDSNPCHVTVEVPCPTTKEDSIRWHIAWNKAFELLDKSWKKRLYDEFIK